MMYVAKLEDDFYHNFFLPRLDNYVNVVRDCVGNYIVSLMIAEELAYEVELEYEVIEFCPWVDDNPRGV